MTSCQSGDDAVGVFAPEKSSHFATLAAWSIDLGGTGDWDCAPRVVCVGGGA